MPRLMNEETNQNEICQKSTNNRRKRKLRRVKSLIKFSIDSVTVEQEKDEMNRKTNGEKRPFPFGQCRVCSDKATGAHYGVPTCEGCKGFFKRSILRKEKYRCYFGDKCAINSDNRNRCKSCRFQKCLKEGMSVDGVRMGRIPKLVKEKALAESTGTPQENSTRPENFILTDFLTENFSLDEENFDSQKTKNDDDRDEPKIVRLNRSALTNFMSNCEDSFSDDVVPQMKEIVEKIVHPTTFAELDYRQSSFIRYLRWKMVDLTNKYNGRIRQLVERMNIMINLAVTDFPGEFASVNDIWAGLTDAIPSHVKNLIAFAREMPAVNEINIEDFHKMMNNRLFDVWLIKHAPLIQNNESYMMLPNGLQYTRRWMTAIIGYEMVVAMFEFAAKFNALGLTNEEQALLFPAVICANDETLQDREIVRNIQYCYLYALYIQMLTTRNQSQAKSIFLNLVQILAYLPYLNELQDNKIGSLIPPENDDRNN